MIGVFRRGTGESILAVALLHTVFNRSNNDEGLVAALVDGDGRKLAGLVAVLVLTAVAAIVVRAARSDPRLTSTRHPRPVIRHDTRDEVPA